LYLLLDLLPLLELLILLPRYSLRGGLLLLQNLLIALLLLRLRGLGLRLAGLICAILPASLTARP
jgi:hypothetical protein